MWLANAPPRICFCHASQNKSVPGIFAGISRSLVRRIQTNEWMNERYLMHHLYLMSVPLLWLDISHRSSLLHSKQKEVNVIELKSLESLWAIHLLSELSSSLWKLKQEVILFRRRNFTQGVVCPRDPLKQITGSPLPGSLSLSRACVFCFFSITKQLSHSIKRIKLLPTGKDLKCENVLRHNWPQSC